MTKEQCPFDGKHFSSMARSACPVCNPDQKGFVSADSPAPPSSKQRLTPEKRRMRDIVARFQRYVATYTEQAYYQTYMDKTFVLDMLFGIGSALDQERFADAEGFKEFQESLKRDFMERSSVETAGRQNAQRINDNGAREIERLDKELEKELENRDRNADYADQLTNMVGVLLGQGMGEHTSENEPWENAIEALRVAIGSKQSPVEPTGRIVCTNCDAEGSHEGATHVLCGGVFRRAEKASDKPLDEPDWQCFTCSVLNPHGRSNCINCGASRDTGLK